MKTYTPLNKTADYEESIWDEVIAVNLKGVWLCMKYEIPVMQKFGEGVIVNISSLAGLKGGDAGVAYHASKFGVVGATRAFTDPDRRANAENMHRVGRFGKVNEVVGAIAWLASEDAAFITGTAIPVDGGASC